MRTVTQEEVTQEVLGGAHSHTTMSGVAHAAYDNDLEALRAARELYGFLPLSCKGELAVTRMCTLACDAPHFLLSSSPPPDLSSLLVVGWQLQDKKIHSYAACVGSRRGSMRSRKRSEWVSFFCCSQRSSALSGIQLAFPVFSHSLGECHVHQLMLLLLSLQSLCGLLWCWCWCWC